MIQSGDAKKGDVLGVARIAGIMASKRTADLIPLCHPIFLTKVSVDFEIDAADHLRHVQGGGPRHGHRIGPAGGEAGRQVGALAAGVNTCPPLA